MISGLKGGNRSIAMMMGGCKLTRLISSDEGRDNEMGILSLIFQPDSPGNTENEQTPKKDEDKKGAK
jgi:hypothetical protein